MSEIEIGHTDHATTAQLTKEGIHMAAFVDTVSKIMYVHSVKYVPGGVDVAASSLEIPGGPWTVDSLAEELSGDIAEIFDFLTIREVTDLANVAAMAWVNA